MIRMPQWKQFSRALRARLTRTVRGAKDWWAHARREPERRINLLFLAASSMLTAAIIGAFLWVAGVLDWRGSDGRTNLTLDFTCNGEPSAAARDACLERLKIANQISAFLNLQPRYAQRATFDIALGVEAPGDHILAPVLSRTTGLQIISDREFGVNAPSDGQDAQVTRIDWQWFSKRLQPSMPINMTFTRTSLMRYTGLSEREFTISLNFTRNLTVLHETKTLRFSVIPPNGFDVVESSPPAERDSSGRFWAMQLVSDDGDFLVRVRLRDFEAARLDHILDSSIAAVLGVAAGGVMTACLALALLRRR
jgi:hypothetical protein